MGSRTAFSHISRSSFASWRLGVSKLLFLALVTTTAFAQNPPERTRLYTKPDPANPGGLRGHIAKPQLPIEQILALPADSIEEVYEGEVSGPKRDTFQFKGLPVGKYEIRSVDKGRVVDQQPVEVKAGTNQTIKVKR